MFIYDVYHSIPRGEFLTLAIPGLVGTATKREDATLLIPDATWNSTNRQPLFGFQPLNLYVYV